MPLQQGACTATPTGAPNPLLLVLYSVALTCCFLLGFLAASARSPTVSVRRQHLQFKDDVDTFRELSSADEHRCNELSSVVVSQGEVEAVRSNSNREDISASRALGFSKSAQAALSGAPRLSETCSREEALLEAWCANEAPKVTGPISCEVHNSQATMDVYRAHAAHDQETSSCKTLWFGGTQKLAGSVDSVHVALFMHSLR